MNGYEGGMMAWKDFVSKETLDWLLEEDQENPSIRYLALKDLMDVPVDDLQVTDAFGQIMQFGPIPQILDAQHPDGYWVEPGPGYLPKYRSTVWELTLLAQLGANVSDDRVRKGCDYLLEHARTERGAFSMNARDSGRIHCLQGNLIAALLALGVREDARLDQAITWMACSLSGDDLPLEGGGSIPVHYLRSGLSGPGFVCSANDHKPCGWGAVKVALALSKIPRENWTPRIEKAVRLSVDFLLSVDPATADYPHPYAPKPSTSWFKFGFPVFYITDVMQILEALLTLGLAGDSRLKNAIDLILEKRDRQGRWLMTYTYNGKMVVDFEEKKKPSKWVTLRAARVLKGYYPA